jgi:hypothetical protein
MIAVKQTATIITAPPAKQHRADHAARGARTAVLAYAPPNALSTACQGTLTSLIVKRGLQFVKCSLHVWVDWRLIAHPPALLAPAATPTTALDAV